ncbi:MarR family winged helix-turn-helix transcriptional regulator [Flaviflexus salsibiostraticola]|uniref:MarR family winged helix-turn-helix transcriptional regulator n=1 Tax=Flaviflexus salsibiostraticola TaxID=1282737 RepID=UPI001B882644|nr:MarR family transcriptional regulator [Flaviflexus salsibiostraticola]
MSSSSTVSLWSRAATPDHREVDTPRQAWRAYWEATALLRDRLEKSLKDETGLRLTDYNLLLLLVEAGGSMRMGELANRMVFAPSRITYRVRDLADRGLVIRESEDADRRGALATITDEGRRVFRAAAQLHSCQVEEYFLNHLSPGDAEVLLTVFTAVGQNLDTTA